MGYTEEEIISTLRDVAKVKDLNQISAPVVVSDILPNYPNKQMTNWTIGHFLVNSRNGHNVRYYDVLHELGFRFYRNGLISQMNIVCEAIDELVDAGVDLNNVPIKAKMGDYISKYRGMGSNFSIGVTLENARQNRECKAVMSKLREHNFNFDKNIVSRQEVVKKIVRDVAMATDLRTIPAKATVRDFLPNYNPEFVDFKIGVLIQNVRAGSYKFLVPTLTDLGFSFEKVRRKNSSTTICNIIDDLVANGIDLNTVHSHAIVGDLIPEHPNKDFCIGKFLRNAALYNVGQEAKNKLEESGFEFTQRALTIQQKIDCVTKVAETVNLNRIKHSALLIDVWPDCDRKFAGWEIGKFLKSNRKTQNPRYKDILKNLGLKFNKKEKKHNPEFVIKAINDLVENGVDLNTVKQRDKMSTFIKSYSKDDLLIGALLSNARCQKTSEEISEELALHNFDFTQKPVTIPNEVKLDVIKRLVESGVDINAILPKHKLSDFVELNPDERDYKVGLWIERLATRKQNSNLYKEIVKLGYQPKHDFIN